MHFGQTFSLQKIRCPLLINTIFPVSENFGLVIRYTQSHLPNWCIKVCNTHPKAALLVGHTNFSQIALAKLQSARGASCYPVFMVSSLTISQTLLLCPPCGKMGLQSWTVLVGINKLWNLKLDRSWQYGGYVFELPLLKPWFATAEMPMLFCFTATEMACTNDGGDHGVMYRWRQLTLAEWEGLMMWGRWGWSMWQTVKDGCNFLLMPVCGSVGGGSRTYVWVEWATMGTFCWIPMRGQEKQR